MSTTEHAFIHTDIDLRSVTATLPVGHSHYPFLLSF